MGVPMQLLLLCALSLCASDLPGQEGKVRIFITDSTSWTVTGGLGASLDTAGAAFSGGARPQTAEIMKTFSERCPANTVTIKRDNADYIVVLDHEGGKELVQRDNKIAVFDRNGDLIYSGSTRTLGNAVKDACRAIGRSAGARP